MDRIYDDPAFFEKYSDMPRSRFGLEGAGEWHVFRNFMPDFHGKDVLDLGCGFGWHARYAAERKARHVVAIDVSERMLAKAESMGSEGIEYRLSAMEDLDFPAGTFDVIISSLAFHYVKDWDTLAATAEGLACSMRIPVGDEGLSVAQTVGAPDDYLLPCYIGLGYPAEDKVVVEQVEYSAKQKMHFGRW